jgi:predicted pyridoxine 5'-phosphate oxidase superfamily flavin-nucleotide-binding protein
MRRTKKQPAHFVLCLNNEGYKASLEVGKLYRLVPDKEAEAEGLIRVVDESGEDYAFDADRFHPVSLPARVEELLLSASHP